MAATLSPAIAHTQVKKVEEAKYHVFYCRIPNSNYIFPDGTQANFTGGRYATQDEGKAHHLREVVKQGNVHIYIDPDKLELTEAELDPMAELKARIIAEHEAKKAIEQGAMGEYAQGKLNVADSNSIGQAAADSSSGATASTPGVAVAMSLK
jgi:hypothetical protein